MTAPRPANTRRKITIEDDMWVPLTELADEHGTNVSEEVRLAVEAYLIMHRKFGGRKRSANLQKPRPVREPLPSEYGEEEAAPE